MVIGMLALAELHITCTNVNLIFISIRLSLRTLGYVLNNLEAKEELLVKDVINQAFLAKHR